MYYFRNDYASGTSGRSGLESAIRAAYYEANSYGHAHNHVNSCSYLQNTYNVQQGRSNNIRASAYAADANATPSVKYLNRSENNEATVIYEAQPFAFLKRSRQSTPFAGAAAEIAGFIKSAFEKTTGKELPDDIIITVSSRQSLVQIHQQFMKAGVAGLSLNGFRRREVFVVSGNMDEVMLVIGHELGHVITMTLSDEKAEEAKAFAFELAWARAIFLHDIAGLRNSINEAALNMKPASNGLHDMAYAFVKAATIGKEPLQLHSELSAGFEEEILAANADNTMPYTMSSYAPLTSKRRYVSGGYLNKSSVQNVPWFQNFAWADLGTSVYGMYIPLTASIFMNDRLLRADLEQFHKTLGHEYILHHVMQLPDGYAAKILEETIFWVKDEKDDYKP